MHTSHTYIHAWMHACMHAHEQCEHVERPRCFSFCENLCMSPTCPLHVQIPITQNCTETDAPGTVRKLPRHCGSLTLPRAVSHCSHLSKRGRDSGRLAFRLLLLGLSLFSLFIGYIAPASPFCLRRFGTGNMAHDQFFALDQILEIGDVRDRDKSGAVQTLCPYLCDLHRRMDLGHEFGIENW